MINECTTNMQNILVLAKEANNVPKSRCANVLLLIVLILIFHKSANSANSDIVAAHNNNKALQTALT